MMALDVEKRLDCWNFETASRGRYETPLDRKGEHRAQTCGRTRRDQACFCRDGLSGTVQRLRQLRCAKDFHDAL
jgi:hypothetical protein